MGFYTGTFQPATDDADWAMVLALFDDAGAAYDASALDFTVQVCLDGEALLEATTTAATLTRPSDSEIAWRFTRDQMATLAAGQTYDVGCVATDIDGNVTQVFVMSLPVINGGLA